MSDPRRQYAVALLLLALSGAGLLFTGSRVWAVTITERELPLGPLTQSQTGAQLVPLVPATGLLLLAAVVAVVATRGVGRVVVGGVVVVTTALTTVLLARGFFVRGESRSVSMLAYDNLTTAASAWRGWPYLSLAAAVLGLVAGLLVAVRGRRWTGLSARYDAPGARAARADRSGIADAPEERAERTARDVWSALDEGRDPTA